MEMGGITRGSRSPAAAGSLDPRLLMVEPFGLFGTGSRSVMPGHEYRDRVSLELGLRVAAELPRRPEWVALARGNIARWTERNRDSPGLVRCYEEWGRLLEKPVEEICAILVEESDEGQRLRQSSPFAGR